MVPVTTIGGYLGAGKTTLINALLRDLSGKRIAVLVNDFGGINIDAALIASSNSTTIALTNGCACCVLSDDLGEAFTLVAQAEPAFDEVFVEASGVADPLRIAEWANLPGLKGKAVVVLADAATIEARLADAYLGRTVRRQLLGADVIVLTKTDLVTTSDAARVTRLLREIVSSTPIETIPLGHPWTLFDGYSGASIESARKTEVSPDEVHSSVHVAFTFCFWCPVTALDLHACFSKSIPGLVRAKGFAPIIGENSPLLLQVVGSTVNLTVSREAPNPTYESVFVVIGLAGVFDVDAFARIMAPLGVGMMGECP